MEERERGTKGMGWGRKLALVGWLEFGAQMLLEGEMFDLSSLHLTHMAEIRRMAHRIVM